MPSPKRDRDDRTTLPGCTAEAINSNKMDKTQVTMSVPDAPSKLPKLTTEYRTGLVPLPGSWSNLPLIGTLDKPDLAPHSPPVSMVELPRMVSTVGSELASGESLWMEGPLVMPSVLGADIPIKVERSSCENSAVDSFANEGADKPKCTDQGNKTIAVKESKSKAKPLTGVEAVEILAKKRHLGELQFYHFHKVESVHFRPYDLQMVPSNKAGTDYYIFSPYTVMHVQDGCNTTVLSLAEWYREAVLWRSLRDIPFFRDYLLRKAFTWWQRNVRRVTFQRRANLLQEQLPIAVPHFRDALLQMSRLIEELKEVHWLPQDVSKMYTLVDFQMTLNEKNQESQVFLEKFLLYRSMILSMVHEDSYAAHQELQLHIKQCQTSQRSQPLHQLLEHQSGLQRDLAHAEAILQRLGNMASLVDCMIVQSLVTIIHREVTSFLHVVLKRERPEQVSLFQGELIFGAEDKLTMFPPLHLFKDVLHGAVSSVADLIMQTFDSCSRLADGVSTSSSLTTVKAGFTPDISLNHSAGETMTSVLEPKGGVLTGVSNTDSKRDTCVLGSSLVLPHQPPLMLHGQRLRGHYFPLSQKQLEWYLGLSATVEEVVREQAKIMQDAQAEVHKLGKSFSWLVDIHLFTSHWSATSLNAMRGWTFVQYEECIQKIRLWADQLRTLPPFFTTSNKLFTVNCIQIQNKIGPLLNSIEEDFLSLITEEIQLRSENLISELKSVVDGLQAQPADFNDFTHFASMVERCKKMSEEGQPQLEYIHSLQETLSRNFRRITPEEVALEEQMLDLWDQFVFHLKQAEETVSQCLPSMAKTLNKSFQSLKQELEDMVAGVTMADYLDPNQNAAQVVSKLKVMCRQLNVSSARLRELSRTSRTLGKEPLDLTFVDEALRKIETRKELWELMTVCKSQIQEWMQLLFSKFVVGKAQEKVEEWQQHASVLSRVIPSDDAVLQGALRIMEDFSQQLPMLAELSSPTLKHKHWKNIFKAMGLLYAPQWNLTVADLMSKKLLEHQKAIKKICRDAKAEADMEQVFRKIQRNWEGAHFQLAKFIITVWDEDKSQMGNTRKKKSVITQQSCDSGTFTIIGLDTLLSESEDSVMTLSNMLVSPHVADFRYDIENWVHLLQELEELLHYCEMYQEKWVFLSKMFCETSVKNQSSELLEKFQPVDKIFRKMIQIILNDPQVLNIVHDNKDVQSAHSFQGNSLRELITDGLLTMDKISSELTYHLDAPRRAFPRLCFLSDGEVIKLLSLHPTPMTLLPVVRKCFPGVRWLEVDSKTDIPTGQNAVNPSSGIDLSGSQIWVNGVYGTLREYVPFPSPLEPNLNPFAWFVLLEQQLKQAMVQQMMKCAIAHQMSVLTEQDGECHRKMSETLLYPSSLRISADFARNEGQTEMNNSSIMATLTDLLSQFPLQCLLVSEEARWCSDVQKTFQNTSRVKWERIKSRSTLKLQILCRAIQDGIMDSCERTHKYRHKMASLRALILLNMKHFRQLSQLMQVKGEFESSFVWHRLMKYHLDLHANQNDREPPLGTQESHCNATKSCYVEILGNKLTYGYEYVGPENWMIVSSPSTERAVLGILLALTNYRCGLVSGPCMSGKRKTVVNLGQALGQHVVTLKCHTNTHPSVVGQMLLGALKTGSWLVLESVDSLTQGALSTLGQQLSDIHQSFLSLLGNTQSNKDTGHWSNYRFEETVGDIFNKPDMMEGRMVFTGKSILAKLSYGCVAISSNSYSVKMPENLRFATRPISLTVPDYTIIMEVLLTSQGFTDAPAISQRLMSLFSMAKDSVCLPDIISGSQTSWLALINSIIATSSSHLHKSKVEEFRRDSMVTEDVQRVVKPSEELSIVKGQTSRFNKTAAILNSLAEEQAVVKGILSVVIPAISDHQKSCQFRRIFEELFPTFRSLPVLHHFNEERDQFNLKNALAEELQKTGLHADSGVISSALTLFQSLKFSQAVLMVGPAGSGKTTCYQALAGALRKLASRIVEVDEENFNEGQTSNSELQVPASTSWYWVYTVVLFPNAMSHEEIFGGCSEKQCTWRDGAFTKVLRESERHDLSANPFYKVGKRRVLVRKMKWLVLDGDPLATPGWLDKLSTLGTSQPFLSLSSGEKVWPSREDMRVLAEVTDISGASPSAVTQCCLVYFSGKDLWKSVWKAEMDVLYREHTLEHKTLKMWKSMAADLFARTLTFIKLNALTSVLLGDENSVRKSSHGVIDGLQEVMSFIRILHAQLEHWRKGHGMKASPKEIEKQDSLNASTSTEIYVRNMFVVAYIWGFGGHLHPRHWPQFSHFARQSLYESRYKVEFPKEGSVFDHCFTLSEGNQRETSNTLSCSIGKSLQLHANIPQYERHAYLLELLVDANQPAILVGETGSGKTTLCQSVLNKGRQLIRVPATPLLHIPDLRKALESMRFQHSRAKRMGKSMNQSGMLLFIDDLHDAPLDASGKESMALEMLRQCITRRGFMTNDGYHFKLFRSGAVCYLGTCSIPGKGRNSGNRISQRLTRQFSILPLPSLEVDILFSFHSSHLQRWLNSFACKPPDMARCIISATLNLYQAMCKNFCPQTNRSLIFFSVHDLQKVFQGMFLWSLRATTQQVTQKMCSLPAVLPPSALPLFPPAVLGPTANVLNIARLWMHECLRTFRDRLGSEEDIQTFIKLLAEVSEGHFGKRLAVEPLTDKQDTSRSACPSPHAGSVRANSTDLKQKQTVDGNTLIKALNKSQLSEKVHCKEKSLFSSSDSSSGSDEDICGETPMKSNTKITPKRRRYVERGNKTDDLEGVQLNTKFGAVVTILKSPMLKKLHKKSQQAKEQVYYSPWATAVDSVPPLQFLKDMGATIPSAVFCPELSEPLNSVSQQNNFKRNSVYQERDLDLLAQQLALTVKGREQEEETEGNDQWKCTASYAVYKARVRQLSHILRVLLIPGGHGALFCTAKGTGRKTTVRLAALLSGYKLMEVHERNEDKFREMLRDAGSLTGMLGIKIILLVHENINQAIRDELLMVMASGTVPDLYSEEDQKELIQRIITSGNSSRNRLSDDQALDKYFRNIQRNLHVFLLLPLIKDGADRFVKCAVLSAHIKKALRLCHCVEIYSPWTGQDLVEIARHQFKDHPLNADIEVDRDTLTASISWATACIHQSAVRYADNYLPGQQPFTSQKYVELIANYLQLCSHMRSHGQSHANRMVMILSRVSDIADIAQQSRQQVITLKDKLKTMHKDHALLLRAKETERTVCARTHWHYIMEKNSLAQLEEQAYEANKQVEDALKQVTQLYKKSVNALKCLSQVDLEEVRRYRCPPEGVVLVMDAICMLFDCPRNWESSKKLLGQPNFFQELEFYDRSSINDKLYKKLSSIVHMTEFQPGVVRFKSHACESLCNWVRALYEHASVLRTIAPQQAQKKIMDASVEESRKHMQEVCMQEELSRERYQEVKGRIEVNRQGMEDVSMQVRLKDVQEREATNTLKQIEYHIAKWKARKKEIEMNIQTIPGDALILVAVITYFGPFGSDVQMELLDKWRELCLHGQTKSNLRDPRASLVTDSLVSSLDIPPAFAIPMDKHLQRALARTIGDEQCVDPCVSPGSVIKLLLWFYRSAWVSRWPLLADIQQHEEFRSQCMGIKGKVNVENEYGLVVSADDPDLLDKLSHGAEKGLKVMVTHLERLMPSPEFLKFLVHPSGSRTPGFICPVRSSHPDFCLFFSTPLSMRAVLREIHPAILKEVQVIDLSLSSAELKELMMSEILQSENPDLWTQHFQIRSNKQSLENKLHHEEMSLMEYVLQSYTPLQQDLAFLPRVAACHKASQKRQGDIEQCCQELECHRPLLFHYRFITDLAVAFYQALQQVAVLSPLYLFTLHNFLTALRHALLSKGQPNVSCNSEGSAMAKVTKRIVLQLMAHYRPCVFQSHFTLLRLLVSVALFGHSEDYTKKELEAFLYGLSGPLQVSLDSAPCLELPSWIPSSVHAELMQLEKIPPFRGLIKSLAANADQWQEYLSFPSSTVIGPIPCQSHAHLSTMQRALLWRTLFPSWLAAVAEDLAACQLGQPVHSAPQVGSTRAPHTGCPEALARYLNKNDGPVIIQLPHPSQGVSASAHPIHWLTQIGQIPGDTRVVKMISLGTNSEKDLILRELEQGAERGHWVVLNNCHLVKEWDEEVVRKLTHILSLAAKGPKVEVDETSPFPKDHVHPLFKVWFITQGENPRSVPAVVRVCALRLVCDSPWDLKEQLCSSLYCVASHLASSPPPHNSSSSSMEAILRCATLHSVLLQRQAFQYLGQGSLYNWTQEDLVTLIEAHIQLSKHCNDTTEALEYIAAYLVYGGHVSDSADLEAVVGVTRACLRSPSASWGSGPHTLAHIISTSGHLGFQGLDHHVQNLRDTNNPLLLGFSSGLAVEQVKLHSHCLCTLLHLSQSLLSGPRALTSTWRHHTLPDYKETRAKLLAIQTSLQHTIDGKGVGSGPMRDFLLMERDRLVEHVASLLASLTSPSRKTPSSWTECTVQAFGKLEKRASLLQDYLGEDLSSSTFFACCLSVFQNPQGFLAALIRQTAQDKQRDVSQVYLQYQVQNISASPSSLPLNHVYLGGLELHGAVWVSKYGAIQDTLSHKPCPLPLVLVWGLDRADERTRESLSPCSPQSSTSAFPVYSCPLYLDPQLTDGKWGLSEKNIITHIPLVSKIDPVLCAQRRVRLICTL
ncbi:dynein heavy chain domain-containing protein 1 [Alosa alosa]|uniref:dynein heavy chain domain-containing protein 1 n=1 Tax=Alosa alosa TaxID=278164 RepID=UPI00201508CD|nr:dynein heavy chain domain-containing protein 1 [Alosa alosa]